MLNAQAWISHAQVLGQNLSGKTSIKWGLKFRFGCAMCHVISHVLGKERENQVWSQ